MHREVNTLQLLLILFIKSTECTWYFILILKGGWQLKLTEQLWHILAIRHLESSYCFETLKKVLQIKCIYKAAAKGNEGREGDKFWEKRDSRRVEQLGKEWKGNEREGINQIPVNYVS